jgi:hypothetical protein
MATRTASIRADKPLFDLVSYGRRGPGQTDRLSPAQVEQISRTVRRMPEVMVKVSGGGATSKAVAAHFKYIDRRGELDIETDDGDQLRGNGAEKQLIQDWDLDTDEAALRAPYSGRPGPKAAKLVHNVILSMPAGTPPARLLAASRAFAREQFALKNRYAMVLHTDQAHPHVHMVIKAMGEQGQRLNIRKATLREWRKEFARHLRERGVEANATERAVRGQNRGHKIDAIFRAARRRDSTHMRERVEAVDAELIEGHLRVEPGKAKIIQTRREVEVGWWEISSILVSDGQPELAARVTRFLNQMTAPMTEKEQLAALILGRARELRARDQHPTR